MVLSDRIELGVLTGIVVSHPLKTCSDLSQAFCQWVAVTSEGQGEGREVGACPQPHIRLLSPTAVSSRAFPLPERLEQVTHAG